MPYPERLRPDDSNIAKTVTLTEKDLEDAARLFKLLVDPAISGNGLSGLLASRSRSATTAVDRQTLIAKARELLDSRHIRKQYFQSDIFGEPAWEILLALYIADDAGARPTMSKLAEWIDGPLTTVARWVKALEEQSLVGRAEHPTDRRIIFIRLLDAGRRALDDYFRAVA